MEISSSMISGSEQVYAAQQNQSMNELEAFQGLDTENMSDEELMEVCQQFEGLFINMLFKSMRDSLPEDKWLDGGMKQEVFEDMLYDEYSQEAAKAGGIGLAQMVYEQLSNSYSDNTISYYQTGAALTESAGIDQEV